MKNLQYIFGGRRIYLGLIFSIYASGLAAQQISPPTLNIPSGETLLPASYFYPALVDMVNPSEKYNYVRTIVPDEPVQNLTGTFHKRQSTDYFDGLGRPLQTVVRKGHANGNDLVTVHVYDSVGRETYQYLPYAAPTGGINLFGYGPGSIKLKVYTQTWGFYNEAGSDEPPFSKTVFDNSPLHRVTKQMAPGKSWVTSNRGVTYDYKTNGNWVYNYGGIPRAITTAFPRWTIANTTGAIPQYAGSYASGQLDVTIITDEDGKISREVKDKAGRVIMKMQQYTNATSNLHPSDFTYTFYIYDELGRLRCVMPPEASKPRLLSDNWNITWDVATKQKLDGLCYQYTYDKRSRLVEKKVPSKEYEYYIYDKRDRQVFYQDGNLRSKWQWAFTCYDGLDRPTFTGLYGTDALDSRATMQSYLDNADPNFNYPAVIAYMRQYDHFYDSPANIQECTILSYTYYDNYTQGDLSNFPFDPAAFSGLTIPNDGTVCPIPTAASHMTRGLPTGSKIRIMDPEDPNGDNWLVSVNYYDDKARVIQAQSENLRHGLDISSNLYFFQGQLHKNVLKHRNPHATEIPGTTDGAITEYKLENTFLRNFGTGGGNDMVKSQKQKINSGLDYQLAYYGYDHLGRNVMKQFTAGANRQDYNMRGFLNRTGFWEYSNSDTLFSEDLYYDIGFKSKLYNGNIAGIVWSGSDHQKRAYGYSYDNLNRLTHAEFRYRTNGNAWALTQYNYTAYGITYDLNGNLKTMSQRVKVPTSSAAPFIMDQLTYTYGANSNQLVKVEDAVPVATTAQYGLPDFKNGVNTGVEYDYDPNGNMVADDNKNITSISYNYLNKPEVITVGTDKTITYVMMPRATGFKKESKV